MKIYTIKHENKNVNFDSYRGHVIVASSVPEVREIAKNKTHPEDTAGWKTARVKKCGNYTGTLTTPFILMSDFKAG